MVSALDVKTQKPEDIHQGQVTTKPRVNLSKNNVSVSSVTENSIVVLLR